MLAIDHGRPKLLPLKDANAVYIDHRREVVLRRTRFELRKAEERAETLEGYLIALANLDEFIRIIRGSANRDEARVKLLAFEFTRNARSNNSASSFATMRASPMAATLSANIRRTKSSNLRLYQLTGLEREKIISEYKELDRDHQRFARHPRERAARLHDHQERAARNPRQIRAPRA